MWSLLCDRGKTYTDLGYAKVLSIVAKASTPVQSRIITLLKPLAIIPTKDGLKVASECYLQVGSGDNIIFDDLPVVALASGFKGYMADLLVGLGVRKHVEVCRPLASELRTWTANTVSACDPSAADHLHSNAWIRRYLVSCGADQVSGIGHAVS